MIEVILRWVSRDWWAYLLAPRDTWYYVSWPRTILCRVQGHPCGVSWYGASGDGPNLHCANCGDDLR